MRKLLIANRGEIASRVIRTAHALGLATVAVFSDPDADAPYVAEADEAVRLPGSAPAHTYLRADAIIAAAAATGADAVHPGYGFLSENADFARACTDAGLTFVGPSPEVIAAMGSKVAAKATMAAAGVPVLPGVTVSDGQDLTQAAADVGFPVLIKAAFGGGGRGMRLVRDQAELAEAVRSAQSEAASAFGDGTVFLERFVENPRHVEVQIMGDTEGQVIHLHERECSIQRRYQKIVEESPSPAVDEDLRARLTTAAVTAGQAVGYTGAGTVEFVLDRDGSFYFLEMNTRLQVEHPVTEEVTGLDLVELQLRIAEGEPLAAVLPDGLPALSGHAIEVRLYAEDVPAGFLPVTGTLHRFSIPGDGIRVEAGFAGGSVVSPHYDAMLAKVIAHGRSRTDAARRLARALQRAQIHGVTTNRNLLVAILREPEFLAGGTDTGYLTRHDPAVLGAATAPPPGHALAAALARQAANRERAPVLGTLPSGWRNVFSAAQRVSYDGCEVSYRITGGAAGRSVSASVGGTALEALVHQATPERVDLEAGGTRRVYQVHQVGDQVYLDGSDGSSVLTELPRFGDPARAAPSGSLLAPMPGLVLRVLAEVGAAVTTGQPVLVLEAMKMEQTVFAPADGVLAELRAKAGDQVSTGQVLAVLGEE